MTKFCLYLPERSYSAMEKGIVFSIEAFAIHDGPGIRTTVFLKGCPLRCAWCHNPEGISPEPQYMDRRDGRTMCGYAICSGELAGKLLRNKAVYAMNRGGVTLTGGEPLLQAAFAAEVLAALQAAGVHTAVETSGYAAPDVFRRVAGHADLVLFDVKHADPVQHRRWTGVDNAPILRNLAWLCTSGRPFVVRIPLIPGVNDTRENMLQTCLLIKDAPGLERVEILRYHKTAGAKYAMIGRTYAPGFDTGAEPRVHDVFSDYNLKTLIQ